MNLKLSPGYTPSGRKITWSGANNPHINISGQSGAGKSYLIKKLAAQAAAQGALVLVLDYTSDFVDYSPPDDLNFQRICVDSPDFSINPLVGTQGQKPDKCAQQLLAALHSVFHMGPRANLALRQITTEYLEKTDSPSLNGLLSYIFELDKPDKGIEAAIGPLGLLATMTNCGNQPISLDLETPGLTILDCSEIIDRNLCKLLVELVLQALWNVHASHHPPLILVLDEAQQLHWGAGSMAIRILREGRKFDIAGWFSSQWCDHKEAVPALSQAAYQVIFRPDGQHVNKIAASICCRPNDISSCQKLLPGLRRGQFLWPRANGQVIIINVAS